MHSLAPTIAALTALYLGICAWVVYLRRSRGVGIGDGGERDLKRAIRVHANFTENVPFALLLLILVSETASPMVVQGLGAALVVSRVLHLIGLGRHHGVSFGRFYGAGGTWAVMTTSAVLLFV